MILSDLIGYYIRLDHHKSAVYQSANAPRPNYAALTQLMPTIFYNFNILYLGQIFVLIFVLILLILYILSSFGPHSVLIWLILSSFCPHSVLIWLILAHSVLKMSSFFVPENANFMQTGPYTQPLHFFFIKKKKTKNTQLRAISSKS